MTFRVPMIEVAVTVALLGTDPEEHCIYLQQFSELRDGPETLAEYVNSGRRFFPMLCGGVARMVNRDQILWLRTPKDFDEGSLERTIIEKLTILELTDGSRLEGVVTIDRPRERSRLSDLLNDQTEIFLRVDSEGETWWLNKVFIRAVIPR